ncbi:hypothetical protein N7519_003925 [Penicillium mononematosum]|uniref:uncharacterized protein n=1 Tax=Penicillium mononematosum TaxID=268346 RepID=UPI002546B44C|nr:uncharacterized protein N7519_003925 [Penicillium mononematosum]KAJ6189017.1 hypothetical protein N7519_003925 [Penicillium mononematosum]
MTSHERELLTELMGEREIYPDDSLHLPKDAPMKRNTSCAVHHHPSIEMPKSAPKHVPNCWKVENFDSLAESFRIVATDIVAQPDSKCIMVSCGASEELVVKEQKI